MSQVQIEKAPQSGIELPIFSIKTDRREDANWDASEEKITGNQV